MWRSKSLEPPDSGECASQPGSTARGALEGFGETSAKIAAELTRLGASRVCAPGTLQTPPLEWPRDGRAVLLPFARRSAIEIAAPGA